MTAKSWAERPIVAFLRQLSAHTGGDSVGALKRAGLKAGIGDDAAVLRVPRNQDLLVTTDLFVEGVHFHRDWMAPAAAGRRALARALSDIAAMGGQPHWAFLSLAIPGEAGGWRPKAGGPAASAEPPPVSSLQPPALDAAWVRGFLRGFAAAARSFGVSLAGGDTGSSGSAVLLADVIVCGSVPAGTAVLRSGAKPGDLLFVSGRLGAAAAALAAGQPLPAVHPRLELGRYLRSRRLATAMIDLSDGLSTDLNHLAGESRAGAEVEVDRLPLYRTGTLEQALNGGEDYELLFTVGPAQAARLPKRVAGVPLTRIGRVVKEKGVRLLYPDGRRQKLPPSGWEHRGRN